MGVTRVGTVCVVLCSGDEERRVRGTGGACRSGGDCGVEPVGINIGRSTVYRQSYRQLSRGSFNVVQRSRNRTRTRTRIDQCQLTSSTTPRHVTVRLGNHGRTSSADYEMWQRGRTTAAFHWPTISTMPTKVAARSARGAPAINACSAR